MPLTTNFKDTVKARMERSSKVRRAMLREAIECLLSGDVNTGKAILRDYINGTIGFEELGDRTHTPAKSLMRMFGPRGNPQAKNLFEVLAKLQQAEGVQLQVR